MVKSKKCHACGSPWNGSPGAQPGRSEGCAQCGADLHCCLNCGLYESSAPNQCTSRTTDPLKNKEKGNYCEEFDFASSGGKAAPPRGDMESKWKDLFN